MKRQVPSLGRMLILGLVIAGCSGSVGWKPPVIPISVNASLDQYGHVRVTVSASGSIVTPIGVFSASASVDPAQYLSSFGGSIQNTLIVRVDGEDHVFDLRGQPVDASVPLSRGRDYRQVEVHTDSRGNCLVVLAPANVPVQVDQDEPNPNPRACRKTDPTQIHVGMRVVVPNDGSGPTALRAVPHSPQKLKMMVEGEESTIIGGPYQCLENTIWWKLRTDDGQEGWSVEQYRGQIGIAPASP